MHCLKTALDSVAPLKQNVVRPGHIAPWYNAETHALKQNTHKLERLWHKSNSAQSLNDWKNTVRIFKDALREAKQKYYSSLIEANKNNPRYLFNTVARLTNSHSTVESSIPATLSSDDFLEFFNNKIATIRENINQNHLNLSQDHFQDAESVLPSPSLDTFLTVDDATITSIILSSNSKTCILDPIPTKIFKEILPMILNMIARIIHSSLENGYVPQFFKYAVIKPL